MVCAIGIVPMSRRRRVGIVGIASPARYCRALIWRIFQESRERRGPAPDVVYLDALASRLSATIGLSTRRGGGANAPAAFLEAMLAFLRRMSAHGEAEPCPSRDYVEASHSHERHTVHGLHEHKSRE